MTLLYAGVALLVVAQIVGIYALVTRAADLLFAVLVVALLLAAAGLASYAIYGKLA